MLPTEKIKEIEIQSEAYTYDKETKLVKASYIICKIAKNNLYFNVETIFDFLTFDKIYLNNEFNCKGKFNKIIHLLSYQQKKCYI